MRLLSDEVKLLSKYVLLTTLERNVVLWEAIRNPKASAQLVQAYRAVDEVL